jgi:hypothetical protein
VTAVILAGAAFAAEEQKPVASIPLRLSKISEYSVLARINGSEPLSCRVDSGGGDRIYLDRDRAGNIGVQPTGTGSSASPQDAAMKQDSRAQVTLEVGGLQLSNQTVLLQSRPYAEYSCVIGQTVFRQYAVEVDYESATIRFFDAERFRYGGSGKAVPFTLDGGNPFVAATLTMPNGNTLDARLAVDTGCGGYALVMLSKSFVDKNDLLSKIPDRTVDPQFGAAGQQARVVSARFEKFVVGPFRISQPVIHLWQVPGFGGSTGPDGLLCGDFLRRFKLIFDYLHQRIILEPNSRFPN